MSLEQAKILAAELGLEEPSRVDPMEAAYRMTDAYYREQMEARTSGSPREDDGEGAILARDFGMNGQPPAEDKPLDLLTEEILFYKRQAGGAIIEIGKRLLEAKAQLGHGEWLPWLREKVDISERSAQNFMRLAREYSKSADIADLGASKALALLALPETERAEFAAETHTVNGVEKTASEMTARELREDARAKSAEESRVKMEADMRQLKELQQRAREAEEEKGRQLQAAEAELQALRSRPVEVAVETRDAAPEQLASAREEGARQAREEAAKAHRRELEEAERQARDNVKKLREELKRAQSESREANLRMQAAEKKAADAARLAKASANENMVTFRVLFESAQDTVNRMADAVGKEGAENQRKMRAALRALAQAIEKAAGT